MEDSDNDLKCSVTSPSSWDDFSAEYEKRVEPFTSQFAEEMLRPLLFESNEPPQENDGSARKQTSKHQNNKRLLLDVGCGTGTVTLQALSHGLKVMAVDVSPAMVERTKEKVLLLHPKKGDATAEIIRTDGQSLPQELSNTYDFVVSNFAVIFFTDVLLGLREMLRCLKPKEGRVAFTAWGSIEETPAFQVFPDAAREMCPHLISTGKPRRITGSVETLTQLMSDAGFINVRIIGPVTKTLVVDSPEEYYNRFALTSPPTAEMISKMDPKTKTEFRNRILELAAERGRCNNHSDDFSIALTSSAYIAYGTKP